MDYDTRSSEEPRRAAIGRNQRVLIGLGVGTFAAILVLGLILGLFGSEVRDADQLALAPAAEPLGAITHAPADFEGRIVTVVGEVDEEHGDGSFTLGEYGALGNEVLVVTSEETTVPAADLGEETMVRVTGKVQILDVGGEAMPDLAPETADEWSGKPIVIAQSVTLTRAIN